MSFLTLTVLAASSLAKRARNAAFVWVGFLVLVDGILANLLLEIFRTESLKLVSLGFNLGQVSAWILGYADQVDPEVPVLHAAVALAAWALLSLVVVLRRTRPVEIVA